MNALKLLKEDHQKVSDLFERFEAAGEEQKKRHIYDQIASELEAHTHIEETIFYPALQEQEELKDMVLEAFEEHKQVKTLIREIGNLVKDSEKFDAKMTVMKENVEHHVEEEENEMFPKVEQLFDESELEELGKEMAAAKLQFGKQKRTASSGGRSK